MKTPSPSCYAPSSTRKAVYGGASILMGLWTFYKVNAVSGPSFEPIIEACMNREISIEEFAEKTGYHIYEPKVGLGIFNVLVCLITQFLLELRETHPEGLLVWCTIIVVSIATTLIAMFEAGRSDVKRFSPIRFPIIIGLLSQLFGVSVIFPLIWNPGYIFGHGFGPLSSFRLKYVIPLLFPSLVLTSIVFTENTDSYLWTFSAGVLGGPILALASCTFWMDQSPPATKENAEATTIGIKATSKGLIPVTMIAWWGLVLIAFKTYDSVEHLWRNLWTDATASVQFMTIDAGILFGTILLWIAFHSEKIAIKTLLLTLIMGPGAAPLAVLGEIENMKMATVDFERSKKNA
mmetsp:Transcript_8421/g.10650  ORF Transcript_8421/g.10650 Transcript_8421/m.10650 type:complete len:349 (-) Transcript_8421:39-1085(-)